MGMCEILSNSLMSHPLNKLTDECASLTCSWYGLHRKESEVNIIIVTRRAFFQFKKQNFLGKLCLIYSSLEIAGSGERERGFLI